MLASREYLDTVAALVGALPVERLEGWVDRLLEAHREGRQLLVLGNGGSAATASHLVADFQKEIYRTSGRTFRALAVTDSLPLITAWGNDTDYSRVFAEQVRTWVNSGDLVLAISGSGNSPNVIEAVRVAREAGAYVLALTGTGGGKLAPLADESVVIPSDNMQQIEDCHMVAGHVLFSRMRDRLAAEGV